MSELKIEVESVEAKKTEQAPISEEANSTESEREDTNSRKKKRSEIPLVALSKLIDGGVHIGLKPNK